MRRIWTRFVGIAPAAFAIAASALTPNHAIAFPPHGRGPESPRPALTGGIAAPTTTTAPAPSGPLRIGIATWASHVPGVLAAGGLETAAGSPFKAANLDVKFAVIDDPQRAKQAFQRGELDIVATTLDAYLAEAPRFGGVDSRLVLLEGCSAGADGIVAAQEILGAEDLSRETSVALVDMPAQRYFVKTLVEAALEPGAASPRYVLLPDASSVETQFRKGKVAAAVLWEPYLASALKGRAGAHTLVSTQSATRVLCDVLVARAELVKNDATRLDALTAAWHKSTLQIRGNSRANLTKAAEAFGLEVGDVESMLKVVDLTGPGELAALLRSPASQSAPSAATGESKEPGLIEKIYRRVARAEGTVDSAPNQPFDRNWVYLSEAERKATPPTSRVRLSTGEPRHLIRLGRVARFLPNTSNLDPQSVDTLDRLGELMLLIPAAKLTVEPAAVGRGGLSLLGKQRAESVQTWLTAHYGIAENRYLVPVARAQDPNTSALSPADPVGAFASGLDSAANANRIGSDVAWLSLSL